MGETFKVEGLKELDKQLARLSKTAGSAALRKTGKEALEPTARIARRLAPDDPNTIGDRDLGESIDVSTRGPRQFPGGRPRVVLHMGPSRSVFHGIYQEFGTANHAPQPFMRPAWDQDRRQVLERIKTSLWDQISQSLERAAKRGAL